MLGYNICRNSTVLLKLTNKYLWKLESTMKERIKLIKRKIGGIKHKQNAAAPLFSDALG